MSNFVDVEAVVSREGVGLHNESMGSSPGDDDGLTSSGTTESDGEDMSGHDDLTEGYLRSLGVSSGEGRGDPPLASAGTLLVTIENALKRCAHCISRGFEELGSPVTDFEREFVQRVLRDEGTDPVLRSLLGQGHRVAASAAPVQESPPPLAGVRQEASALLEPSDHSRRRDRGPDRQVIPRGAYAGRQGGGVRSFDEFVQGLDASGDVPRSRQRVFSGYPSRTSRW